MTVGTTVLFVCTGNIFRSMTAEYALRQALPSGTPVMVCSAGVEHAPHEIVDFVHDYHRAKGIDLAHHVPRKLTRDHLASADLAIAMDVVHCTRVFADHSVTLPLFNQLAYGRDEPMPDVCDVVPDWRNNAQASRAYGYAVMDRIYAGMPGIVAHLSDGAQTDNR